MQSSAVNPMDPKTGTNRATHLVSSALIMVLFFFLTACQRSGPQVSSDTAEPAPDMIEAQLPQVTITPGLISSEETAWIIQAVSTTAQLKSYEFSIIEDETPTGASMSLGGFYVAPGNFYTVFSSGGNRVESLYSNGSVYQKTSGKWVAQPNANAFELLGVSSDQSLTRVGTPGGAASPLPVGTQHWFADLTSLHLAFVGEETLDGVLTRHFVTIGDAKREPSRPTPEGASEDEPPEFTVSLWIDPQRGYMHKLSTSRGMQSSTRVTFLPFLPSGATPGSAPSVSDLKSVNTILTITRHNDPTIKLPIP